jgi:hypothetical protein
MDTYVVFWENGNSGKLGTVLVRAESETQAFARTKAIIETENPGTNRVVKVEPYNIDDDTEPDII